MYQWPSWLTRKNPWYSWPLAITQISLAGVLSYQNKTGFSLFMAYLAGINTVMAIYPENAPDSI